MLAREVATSLATPAATAPALLYRTKLAPWSVLYCLLVSVFIFLCVALPPLIVYVLPFVPSVEQVGDDRSVTRIVLLPLSAWLHPALSLVVASVTALLVLAVQLARIPRFYEGLWFVVSWLYVLHRYILTFFSSGCQSTRLVSVCVPY